MTTVRNLYQNYRIDFAFDRPRKSLELKLFSKSSISFYKRCSKDPLKLFQLVNIEFNKKIESELTKGNYGSVLAFGTIMYPFNGIIL